MTVPAALDGQRVDRAVALVTGSTRREVAAWIERGQVRVDGQVVTNPSSRVRVGQQLAVERAATTPAGPVVHADPTVAVPVVYADDAVIVVDKPAGLVVHPGAGNPDATLVNGLLARFPELAAWADSDRPGIVHRLDRATSGLLVVARTEPARQSLVAQLAARSVSRQYQALVVGLVEEDEGIVDAPIGRSPRRPTAMAVSLEGRAARTHFNVEGRYRASVGALGDPSEVTRLDCRLETGRTHQIRVHLAAIEHPVVGDDRYGRSSAGVAQELGLGAGRLWLHAASLAFEHPESGQRVTFRSALPDDLAATLGRLTPLR